MTKLKNHEAPIVEDKKRVDTILIGLGIPIDMMNFYDEDYRNFE